MDRSVGKLQTLVRIPTVSYRDWDTIDVTAFDGFVEELAAQFPLLHEHLELTRIHTHGLLFHWRGRSADTTRRADGTSGRRPRRGRVAARRVLR